MYMATKFVRAAIGTAGLIAGGILTVATAAPASATPTGCHLTQASHSASSRLHRRQRPATGVRDLRGSAARHSADLLRFLGRPGFHLSRQLPDARRLRVGAEIGANIQLR